MDRRGGAVICRRDVVVATMPSLLTLASCHEERPLSWEGYSMKYGETYRAKFIDRPNRFIAHVALNGKEETVHVKNTGRCRELLLPGADVILSHSGNPSRKTAYDLIAVYKPGIGLVNIDSQAPNMVVKEWLQAPQKT